MCGIAGILRVSTRGDAGLRPARVAIPEAWLDALDTSIAQRGPDGRGRFRDRGVRGDGAAVDVALVQRRLSILDHAGGRQPMVATDGGGADVGGGELFHGPSASAEAWCGYEQVRSGPGLVAVVFNGCIYNHRALRAGLVGAGHVFASDHSDTEVLLHGWRAWGAGLGGELDGMFAFAVWDRAAGVLALARDQAGEKPMYASIFSHDGDEVLAFGSSCAGVARVMRLAGVPVVVDAVGVGMWLKHGYWPRLPVNISEVEPGATHVISAGASAGHALAKPACVLVPAGFGKEHDRGPISAAEVQSLLLGAVHGRLDADVPIGCFLSGGVDSSVVAAVAQAALAQSGRRLLTFHVAMAESRMDESPYARMVAAHIGSEHVELTCKPSAAGDLVRLIAQLGLPFGDSSLLPTHWVSVAARERVAVALGGDGGDELFGGYQRYQANEAMARASWLRPVVRAVPACVVGMLGGSAGRVATALRNHGYDDVLTIFRTPQVEGLLGAGRARELLSAGYAGRDVGGDARQDDFAVYLPGDLMRKVDTASMAVALEVRAPLLERGVVGRALRATLGEVYAGQGRKGLLRQVARQMVPAAAIDRKKMGFGVPMGRWVREDFAGLRTLLNERFSEADPWPGVGIDKTAAMRMLREHDERTRDHGQRLYMLLVMSLWAGGLARG